MYGGYSIKRQADEERVKKVVDYVLKSEQYSFEKLLNEKNLLQDSEVSGDSFFIKCPFHIDYSPSMRVSLSKGIYKCFSCGSGGGYFKFLVTYHQEVLKDDKNYYTIVEDILKSDRLIQIELGFNSIFKEVSSVNPKSFKRRKFSLDSIDTVPQTYVELANMVAKDSTKTEQDIVFMLMCMQTGVPVDSIYNDLYKKTNKLEEVTKLDLDFSAILSE